MLSLGQIDGVENIDQVVADDLSDAMDDGGIATVSVQNDCRTPLL